MDEKKKSTHLLHHIDERSPTMSTTLVAQEASKFYASDPCCPSGELSDGRLMRAAAKQSSFSPDSLRYTEDPCPYVSGWLLVIHATLGQRFVKCSRLLSASWA